MMALYFNVVLLLAALRVFLPAPSLPSRYHKQVGTIAQIGRVCIGIRLEIGLRKV